MHHVVSSAHKVLHCRGHPAVNLSLLRSQRRRGFVTHGGIDVLGQSAPVGTMRQKSGLAVATGTSPTQERDHEKKDWDEAVLGLFLETCDVFEHCFNPTSLCGLVKSSGGE